MGTAIGVTAEGPSDDSAARKGMDVDSQRRPMPLLSFHPTHTESGTTGVARTRPCRTDAEVIRFTLTGTDQKYFNRRKNVWKISNLPPSSREGEP